MTTQRPAGTLPRADDEIRTAVVEELTVPVEGGVVTLSGTVLTWAERRQVENLCWAAPGVAVVENNLKIGS